MHNLAATLLDHARERLGRGDRGAFVKVGVALSASTWVSQGRLSLGRSDAALRERDSAESSFP